MKVRKGAQDEVRDRDLSRAEVAGRIKRARKRSRRSFENVVFGLSLPTVILLGGVTWLVLKKPAV